MERNERFPYAIWNTAFHGGGLVSQHKHVDSAAAKMRRLNAHIVCTCGCYAVTGPAAERGWNGELYLYLESSLRPAAETLRPDLPAL